MAAFNKFETFVGDLGDKVHDLQASGDTVKVYLTNATPDAAADSIKTDLAEIGAGFGYTAGGEDTQQDWVEAAGVGTLSATDVTWTASGGTIGPFRYVVLYNDTPASPLDPLIAWWDYGSAVTLLDGESFLADFTGDVLLTIT